MILKSNQFVALAIVALTKPIEDGGVPADLDGPVAWNTTDPGVIELVPDPADPDNASKRHAYARGKGSCQVSASADADLGPGLRPLTGFLDFNVLGEEATVFLIEAGEPQDA